MKTQISSFDLNDFNSRLFFLHQILMHLTLGLTLGLFVSVNASFALSWDDNEWLDEGCPPSIIGTWVSDSQNLSSDKEIKFEKDKMIIREINGDLKKFLFASNLKTGFKKFVEISLNSNQNLSNFHIKVRPHLVSSVSQGDNNNNRPDCFIKIFKFLNQKNFRLNKYSSWDIYQYKY